MIAEISRLPNWAVTHHGREHARAARVLSSLGPVRHALPDSGEAELAARPDSTTELLPSTYDAPKESPAIYPVYNEPQHAYRAYRDASRL